ncbi:MAG: DUF5752 family protein [Deltaproteobacteria bacterium]
MEINPFHVKDCALLRIATGEHAQNLNELRDKLLTVHPESIYYHYWGRKFRPRFTDPEYNNDFAEWAYQNLHDAELAERLSVIDPSHASSPEELRAELIDVIEKCLYERETAPASRQDEQFYFVRAQVVVFDTDCVINKPEELPGLIDKLSDGSVFYHFINAARRTENRTNDFSAWLSDIGDGYGELSALVSAIEPYFLNMTDIRERLKTTLNGYLKRQGK